jgi:hypothetical protein
LWADPSTSAVRSTVGARVRPRSDEFEPFDPDRYTPLPAIPAAHIAYLQRMRERGEPPLMFVHIPHVLVGRPIDVGGLEVVSWTEPPPGGSARSRPID